MISLTSLLLAHHCCCCCRITAAAAAANLEPHLAHLHDEPHKPAAAASLLLLLLLIQILTLRICMMSPISLLLAHHCCCCHCCCCCRITAAAAAASLLLLLIVILTLRICIMSPISLLLAAALTTGLPPTRPAAAPPAARTPSVSRSCSVRFLRSAAYSCAWRRLRLQRSVICNAAGSIQAAQQALMTYNLNATAAPDGG
jgi:hypothetical protein